MQLDHSVEATTHREDYSNVFFRFRSAPNFAPFAHVRFCFYLLTPADFALPCQPMSTTAVVYNESEKFCRIDSKTSLTVILGRIDFVVYRKRVGSGVIIG